MSRSPSLPDRPTLDLDPNMSKAERLEALREHYARLRGVSDELEERLSTAQARRRDLRDEVDRLQRENETLKTSSLYVATVEELSEDGVVIKQHGNNQEVLTEATSNTREALEPGSRVAVNDSFAIQTVLSDETDSRAQAMQVEQSPGVAYEDIGGLEDQIRDVREAVEIPLENPGMFDEVGIDPPAGVLLHGPPGTGKTMLAKAVANKTDATFISEGARLVRDLFQLAEDEEPAIIFIDEIDAIASKRTESKTSGDAEVQRTMMQLLSNMDGFEERGNIRIIAATNRFDMLDEAILRPGRFDRLIEVPTPDETAREHIFTIHTRGMNLADETDFRALARRTPDASGADINAICTEAGMVAIRDDRTTVEPRDFHRAIDKLELEDSDGSVSRTFA